MDKPIEMSVKPSAVDKTSITSESAEVVKEEIVEMKSTLDTIPTLQVIPTMDLPSK
jgi:hypothetical protein